MIRLLGVFLWIVPATIWFGGRMIWAVFRGSADVRCICRESPRGWARQLLRLSGVDVVFENLDVIDSERPQVLVANHSSWYDVLALVSVPGTSLFVAKKELSKIPIFGRAIGGCGHIFIDRQDRNAAVQSLGAARELLEKESPTIIMFPEGTRTRTGELQSFKKGAFVLAIQTGVEVVPGAIIGSRDVMRKGSLRIRPGTITVRFGAPISVEGLGWDDRNQLTERARAAVRDLQADVTRSDREHT
jgi:1-acyl-sn-glycerol-3-phosphate acyltransferase